ncbi:MAG: hypothetical protein AAFU03_15770, partial [Bacteroidota bacterium]
QAKDNKESQSAGSASKTGPPAENTRGKAKGKNHQANQKSRFIHYGMVYKISVFWERTIVK